MQNKIAEQQKRREEVEAQLPELQMKQHSAKRQDGNLSVEDSEKAAALSQVEVERSKAEQYLLELQQLRASHAAMSQNETDNSKTENDYQALQALQASHVAKLEELRRRSDFFKNNSERLSRQTREMMATNRSLQQSVQAKDREVEEQTSLIYVLKVQIQELRTRSSQQG